MDLGSLFSGFGSVPPNNPNPPPNTVPGTFSSGSWIIILIILFIVFRYGNGFPGLFSNPFRQYPPPGEPAEPIKNSKKHHKHKHRHKDAYMPYPPPQTQNPFGMFGQPGMM